jgi:DNA-binding GntR family transcriptional regulator
MPSATAPALEIIQAKIGRWRKHGPANPGYIEVRNLLAELIGSGALSAGTRLPSERDLHELLGVARGTLRDALTVLEAEGALHRLDRRGWFVSPPRVRYDPTTLEGFHAFVSAQGRRPHTQTLSKRLAPMGAEAAGVFGLDRTDPVFLIVRKRSIDSRPVLIEHIYVDPQRFPGLIEHDLDGSLSAVLETKYGVATTHARMTMYPSILTGVIADELQVSNGTPSLFVSRICYAEEGFVTEFNLNFWHHNAFKMVMEVRKAPHLLPPNAG